MAGSVRDAGAFENTTSHDRKPLGEFLIRWLRRLAMLCEHPGDVVRDVLSDQPLMQAVCRRMRG